MKKLYFLIIAGLFLINLANICLAADETKVITTYYPSPQGIYNSLKLFPHHVPAPPPCNSDNEGMIFYCDDPTACGGAPNFSQIGLYSCSADSGGNLKWQFIGAGGGYWTLDSVPTPDYLYTNDSDTAEDWNVGIGTTTPLSKLHITGGGLLISGTTGSTPVNPDDSQLGAGTRLMWIPAKAAFRAGGVDADQWNDTNIGQYSFATGYNTVAKGTGSVAMGNTTTTCNPAIGTCDNYSVAMGYKTVSSGSHSLAMGWGTCATGADAVAMGVGDLDGSNNPTWNRCARAPSSITMGRACQVGTGGSSGRGFASWAAGDNSIADANDSIAWGYRARTPTNYSYSMAVGLDDSITSPNFCETENKYQLKICGDLHVADALGTSLGNITAKEIEVTGNVTTVISSKFKIPHPDPAKPAGTFLEHSTIESPSAGDNLYRWTVIVENGKVTIDLPDYHKYLNKDDMIWVAPVDNFGRGYGEVNEKQETLTVKADLDGRYNVVLIGTRKDEAAEKYWHGPEEYIEPQK